MSKLAYSVDEAAVAAGVSRSTIYNVIRAGELIARKSGRRTLILPDDLSRWLSTQPVLDLARKNAGVATNPADGGKTKSR